MERTIAVYSCDGALVQWIDQKRLDRLIATGRVARVIRKRNGKATRVTLHRRPGESRPSFLSDYVGTKYSFRQHLDDGHYCFRLRALGDKDGDNSTQAAGDKILSFAKRDPWLADQLSLFTFGEFEAFIAGLGNPQDIVDMPFETFQSRVKEKAGAVLLRMDDLKGVKFGTWLSPKTLADLDKMNFTREGLDEKHRTRPIVRYLLDKKQSRRQYRLDSTKKSPRG